MNTSTDTSTEAHQPLQITKDLLKTWGACASGYKWFLEKFPEGGSYRAVHAALHADKRLDDAHWLSNQAWDFLALKKPTFTTDLVQSVMDEIGALHANIGSGGHNAKIGSSGDYARIGSSGDYARIGSSGVDARISSSGYAARISASGKDAVVCCAGMNAVAAAGENGVLAMTWFDESSGRARVAVGYVGETLQAGVFYRVSESGAFVEVDL